ncbi:uncharacterized protein LOC123516441 isoform X2 [Portunus trituberculatus]|uniref:uncharacterized protein LOC123516441 isoform X2 n=1 Tax=Portunus trituberculatus TaxID=210409 RepID=UPI001E1CBAE4|nr:uncharacterized protein LOC123516441 isoform X2 [Portunus trituberculatus]
MVDITGRVTALSHSFRVLDGFMFFLKLDSGGETEHILVKEPKFQEWHLVVEVNGYYTFTCLHPVDIDLAKVAEVIDEEVGIYLLDNNMKLYITFLKDLTGEIWNEESPYKTKTLVEALNNHQSFESERTSSHLPRCTDVYKCLKVGDTVRIIRCHYILKEKKVTLVCCGQSYILNESRKFFLNIDSCVKIPWITSAVHFLNLNFKGLTWLLRLKEELLSVLPSSISTSACHSSPSHSSDSSLLMLLLDEAKKRNMMKEMKPRSAVEEFLEPFHECTIMKDFVPPFQLVSLKDILDEQTSNNSSMTSNQDQQIGHSSQFNDFWSYNISPESKYSNVLVGKLGAGQDGVLQLHQAEVAMDLVLIGNAGMALSSFGTTIALFNYRIVRENFHMNMKDSADFHKIYLVSRNSDLIVLEEAEKKLPTSKRGNYDQYSYKFKLLSKSALVVPHHGKDTFSFSKFLQSKFFVGMTTLMKIGYKEEVLETWQKFVKFSGENACLYPLLEVGDECELKIPPSLDAEAILKRSHSFNWMKCISEDQSTHCLFLPSEILVQKVSSVQMKWGEIGVQQVQNQGDSSELLTITGTVMCKIFVLPKFESECSKLAHHIYKDCHIGVPEGRQIKILIKDEDDCMLWLYITCSTNYFTKIYPLFVVPGIRIIATDVRRMVAKNKNVYMSSSNFTHIIPLSISNQKKQIKLTKPHLWRLGMLFLEMFHSLLIHL